MSTDRTFTAFAGHQQVATGGLEPTLLAAKRRLDSGEAQPVLIFEDRTGDQIDFDFRGTPEDVVARLVEHPMFAPAPPPQEAVRTGPGRPKLGVVSREVSLLPRHWEWLDRQVGGMSATLRRLVEEAKKSGLGKEQSRAMRDAAGKFIWAIAGNLPNFEEASRALYAGEFERMGTLVHAWPKDIREHVARLVEESVRLAREEQRSPSAGQ